MYKKHFINIDLRIKWLGRTEIRYKLFRYFDSNTGNGLSQDLIRLQGGNPTLYGYVKDVNSWVDVLGLKCSKKIVLGEGMDRVKDAAKKNDAKWYQAWGKNFPKDGRKMTPEEFNKALKRNERWLKSKIKDGYEIIDIGIDVSRSKRSPFYELEQKILNEAGAKVKVTRI